MAIPFAAIAALAQFAPVLMKYMGIGQDSVPAKVAETAAQVATAVTGTSNVNDAITALASDPNKVFEFRIQMLAHEKEMDQMYLADVDSARKRDSEFVKAGIVNHRANIMFVMAWIVVLIAFYAVWKSQDLDDFVKATITLILGRFLGYLDQIYQFEFGSTRSNKDKDAAIMNLTNRKE